MGPRRTKYLIDFSAGGMQQTNLKTGCSRPVRRVSSTPAPAGAFAGGGGAGAFAGGGGAGAAPSALPFSPQSTALPISGSVVFQASTRAPLAGGASSISAEEFQEMQSAVGWTEVRLA
jgi:hypothetical protein